MPLFPLDLIAKRAPTLWRYEEALPAIAHTKRVTFQEGFTPLLPYRVGKLEVMLKLDYLFPTGSYKDRGATVLMSHANQEGIKEVVQDSSGNAGCAIAGYAARAGIECTIFVPANTSPAKIVQINMYGAKIRLIEGDRDATASACKSHVSTHNVYYASHVHNALFFEGTKTLAYEICEQLGWQAPDTVVLPAGNGTLLLGAYQGFQDLAQAGIITKIPKLIGIQAQNCAPLYALWVGKELPTSWLPTAAEGIAIPTPYLGDKMIAAMRQTNGACIAVSEDDIKKQLFQLARQGYYVEPTAACVIAGLEEYARNLTKSEKIVSVLTGTGLKATEKIQLLL